MANPYKPVNLHVSQITEQETIAVWSLPTALQGLDGIYYKIYTSDDSVNFIAHDIAHAPIYSFKASEDPFFVKVSIVAPSLGEGPMSDIIGISAAPCLHSNVYIANDPNRVPAKINVDEDGNLKTSITTPIIPTAREILEWETEIEDVPLTGQTVTIPAYRSLEIKNIVVMDTEGTSGGYTFEVYRRSTNPTYKDRVHTAVAQALIPSVSVDKTILYKNAENRDEITLRITPVQGQSSFFVRISGFIAK